MKKKLGIILLALLLVQFSVGVVYGQVYRIPKPRFQDMTPEELAELQAQIEAYYMRKSVGTAINAVMMAYILWFYYRMYRENGSRFSLGLIALSAALLVHSLSSNPWLMNEFLQKGVKHTIWLNDIPDYFTTIAAGIMIYLTRT